MVPEHVFIHPSSFADEGSEIGAGTKVWSFSHVMEGAVVGENCNIGEHVFIETGVVLGDGVKVKNNISIYTGVTCEDDVFLGPACVFTNVINPRSFIPRKNEFKKTLIRKGASIGAGAIIVCGCEIGQYAFVGAGGVVTRDVPDYALVYGNPARVKGYICRCGEKLDFTEGAALCKACGAKYRLDDKGCVPSE